MASLITREEHGVKGKTAKKPVPSQVSRVDWQSERLSPEQARFLNLLFSRFAEALAPRLTSVLGLRALVGLQETSQTSFKEFLDLRESPAPLIVFDFDNLNKALFALDGQTAFSLLEYLLGGKGEPLDENREFTTLEHNLFRNHIASPMLTSLGEAAKDLLASNPSFDSLVFSPNSLVAFPYGEPILIAKFSIRVGIVSGRLQFIFPLHALRELIPKNPEKLITTSLTKTPEPVTATPGVGKKLEKTSLPVTAELGDAQVFFQDLIHLETGDVIRLETRRGSPLKLKVAGKTKFLGKPGASEKKMAIRITEIVEEGENPDE